MNKILNMLRKKSSMAGKSMLLIFAAMLMNHSVFAQSTAETMDPTLLLQVVLAAVIVVSVLVLAVSAYIVYIMRIILLKNKEEIAEATDTVEEEKLTLMERLNGLKPMEEEKELLMDHEYDGIRELDNHLPPWWKYLFYATIVFAVVYVGVYHVFDAAPLQQEEYELEIAQAKAAAEAAAPVAVIDENTVEMTNDAGHLKNGKAIYDRSCAACHGNEGQGIVGPNLTDKFWLHGGSVQDIFKTIKYGVPGKGMIPWEGKLSPASIRDVTSYIITLEGTNPPGAKGPQGEKFERNI